MELRSSEGAALVGVASEAAPRIAIRPPGKGKTALPELALPAGDTRALAAGSYRLKLVRVSHPLKLGEWVPLTLTFRNPDGTEQQMAIRAEVRRRSAIDDHRRMFTH
jgi:copper(I)-binding protein